ncbi:MAG: hypothetical protein OHK0029_42230 [Armatimonadaceae bacterium]
MKLLKTNGAQDLFRFFVAGCGVLIFAAAGQAQTGQDYPVTVGKQTIRASQVPVRETVRQPSRPQMESSGRFVQRGKATIWIPNRELRDIETDRSTVRELSEAPASVLRSDGQFIRIGKAIIWLPFNQ